MSDTPESDWTVDELLCVAMAREIEDGDMVLEGIGTFLPSAAYELARATHAPNLTIFSPMTGSYRIDAVPLALSRYETTVANAATKSTHYGEVVLWHLPAYLTRRPERCKEFLRPAQVDPQGRTNNVRLARAGRPDLRLPGAVGIPDTTALHEQLLLYLPRHEPRAFAARVDFVSGAVGEDLGALALPARPARLVTDLGLFAFDADGMYVVSLHPGSSLEAVRERTAIAVAAGAEVATTAPPTARELALLRDKVDPLGLRRLELLPTRARIAALRELAVRA